MDHPPPLQRRRSDSNSETVIAGDEMERRNTSPDMEMDDMRSEESGEEDEETGLTETQRKRRRRRKEQNARLDARVASGAASIGSGGGNGNTLGAVEGLAGTTMVKNLVVNALLIALWYSFSISISVYNKWMFSAENLDFHYPLFVTSGHMLVQFTLAACVLFWIPRFRPTHAPPLADPHNAGYRPLDGTADEGETPRIPPSQQQPLMSKWFYFTRIGPCGTATALDIGLGNFSLRFISLTFFTMCKSSVLVFVLLFAFVFSLETPTWRLCTIILFMTAGVIMMVAGETAFDALGFVLVMTASLSSGFRWSLTQIMLLRNRATSNPFSSIFFLTPVMFLALFLLALPIEGPTNVIAGIKELAAKSGGFTSFLLLLFPGILAFLMVSAEFALLQRTSVVTLSVCGIFKEVLTISAAGIVFGDELSPINVSGLIVTVLSIAAYNYLKYSNMKEDAVAEARGIVIEDRVEERRKASADGIQPIVLADDDDVDERRDSTSALMSDSSNLPATDINDGVGQSSKSDSPIPVDGKKQPDRL